MVESNESFSNLTDRRVVITGASGLLGRQHARAILLAGGTPILVDINERELELFRLQLQEEFGKEIVCYQVDITNEREVASLSKDILKRFGSLEGLVNNAAVNAKVEGNSSNFRGLEDVTREIWDLELGVGLYGALICSRIFAQLFLQNDKICSIINISSDHGIIAPRQNLYDNVFGEGTYKKPVTYSVVKHGIIGLTKYLATYWAGTNIRVNTLSPGGVYDGQNAEFVARLEKEIPVGRMANEKEYMGAIVFLLSDSVSYMNGSNLVVDGGRSIW